MRGDHVERGRGRREEEERNRETIKKELRCQDLTA